MQCTAKEGNKWVSSLCLHGKKANKVFPQQTLNENRIPMLCFPLKQFLSYWQAQSELAKAILPQYYFLTLVLCNNCGLHCKRCFEAWTSGCFQIVPKQNSPLLVASSTISASIFCAGHRLLQRTQRCQSAVSSMKEMLPEQITLTSTTCNRERKRKDKKNKKQEKPLRKLIPNTWFYLQSAWTPLSSIQHLLPKHPLDPKLPVIQLRLVGSYISNQLCCWAISVKQNSGRVQTKVWTEETPI